METLAAALPQEGDIAGTYFSVECRSLQEPCADLWGVGVVVSEEPEDPASASTTIFFTAVTSWACGPSRDDRVSLDDRRAWSAPWW